MGVPMGVPMGVAMGLSMGVPVWDFQWGFQWGSQWDFQGGGPAAALPVEHEKDCVRVDALGMRPPSKGTWKCEIGLEPVSVTFLS